MMKIIKSAIFVLVVVMLSVNVFPATKVSATTEQSTTETQTQALKSGWVTKDGKKYYYIEGEPVTGWNKISGKYYYFATSAKSKGVLQKNKIVGTKKKRYYVDKNGVRVTAKEVKLAVKFVDAHTKSGWSKDKKLKACFNYLWKHYTYQRFYDKAKPAKMPSYAKYMFSKKKGNCYRYAAAFAYIARVLGYDSRVAIGSISNTRGGMSPHGWTEVKKNGKWYICDANMQRNFKTINSYMRTKKTYAYKHECSKRATLTIKKGKVTWK